MHTRTRSFCVALLVVVAAIAVHGQPARPDEFASIIGRFGIMLPQNYAEYRANVGLSLADDALFGASYLWFLDTEQATVSYATGTKDFEAKPDRYFKAFREDFLLQSRQVKIVSEQATSLGGHPGLVFVVETKNGRGMVWIYLVKNRVYWLRLTQSDPTKHEQHIKLLSTFRLLTRQDLEPRYAKLIEDLTPAQLPQESIGVRPTNDTRDAALKGKVKQVITEKEDYIGEMLFDNREIVSVQDFDEGGNLVRTVLYTGDLPQVVRTYGFVKGERAFREMRRFADFEKTLTRNFKLTYKHDSGGQLLEMRVVEESGREFESWVYGTGSKTLEHIYDIAYDLSVNAYDTEKWKTISKLDSNEFPIEDSREITQRGSSNFHDGFVTRQKKVTVKHKYELDDRGNWIKRITRGEGIVRNFVTYRTIIYY